MFELLDGLEFPAAERDRAAAAALSAPALVGEMGQAARPSRLHAALAGQGLETVALAGALGSDPAIDDGADAADAARRWLDSLRHVRLTITGEDLLAAGIPQGPQIGQRLAHALARRLDGELENGRDAELRAALEALP